MTVNINKQLKLLNSFSIDVLAKHIITANTKRELITFWQKAIKNNEPVMVLGDGSNVLFLENYTGTILLNRIKGLLIKENQNFWHLHIGSGEIWHNLVTFCIQNNIPGLENLALIPGRVGSAPVQNIGAYGVELSQFCSYVEVIQLSTGTIQRIKAADCRFSYRDSIFKHSQQKEYIIVAVGLLIPKAWQPVLNHNDLTMLNPCKATPWNIYNIVCTIRRAKFPNPKIQGNAGSFFKNPIIDNLIAQQLLNRYPDAPHYLQSKDKVKVAAGWLIDKCGLKGYRLGNASVHAKQALVLVNLGKATSKDIINLAQYIYTNVKKQFGICLKPEVHFIGANGEIDADQIIA